MAEISAAGDAPDSPPRASEEDARTSASEARKPPLICLAMLKNAIGKSGVSSLDVNGLSRAAYEGVLLQDEEQGEARNGNAIGKSGVSSLDVNGLSRAAYEGVLLQDEEQGEARNGDAIGKSGLSSLDVNGLSRAAYEGVLLQDEEQGEARNGEDQGRPYTRKYWVHEELNKNCWMVLAKALSITLGDDSRYWKWPEEEEPCYPDKKKVHVAELRKVNFLEIKGEFNTILLSPWTMYKVDILVKMRPESRGWELPVNLRLALPDGTKQERTENLGILKKEKWFPISIGKFETTPENVGKMSFSLAQTGGVWKFGLCVRAIRLMPTTEEN